ncbi:hypothetical protein ASF88_19970 [Leifsonia sp. Leaf336]|nr:hypothetical protein ASF88_19970 [Leifsonia sp. Leaf336]
MTDITTAPGASSANPTVTVGYCYDNADRLTSDTITGAPANPDIVMGTNLTSAGSGANLVYDTHGNITTLGTETLGYDDTNRHQTTTLVDGTTVSYQRDATDRVIAMTQTPAGGTATTTHYSYGGTDDAAAYTLTATNTAQEQALALPGGVTVSIRATAQVWSYPGLTGNDLTTTDAMGTRTGAVGLYDPFGDPIDPGSGGIGTTTADASGPSNTTTPNVSNGFEGQHGRGSFTLDGLNTVEMGARQYIPLFGRFLSTDPIVDGNSNTYNYPNDPINSQDISGEKGGIAGSCSAYLHGHARSACNARTHKSVAKVTQRTNRKIVQKVRYYQSHPRDLVIDGTTFIIGGLSGVACTGITEGTAAIPCFIASHAISEFLNHGLKTGRAF